MAKKLADETPEPTTGRKRTAPSQPPLEGGAYDENGKKIEGLDEDGGAAKEQARVNRRATGKDESDV